MTREFAPRRIDVNRFAETAATLSGDDDLQAYPRLAAEAADPASGRTLRWEAAGVVRADRAGVGVPWLHLVAQARVPLICQRCLTPVDVDLQVDRWFRFAADEATAAAQDEEADEDVLAASRDFDLHALIEDELLMEIPVTPKHEVCPAPMRLSAEDPDFEAADKERKNAFAALAALRAPKAE